MTGIGRSSDGLDVRRRRVLFRSWHRGTREMDLLMGRFADARVEAFDEGALDSFERLMELPDPQVLNWILGVEAVPAEHDRALLRELCDFHAERARAGEGA